MAPFSCAYVGTPADVARLIAAAKPMRLYPMKEIAIPLSLVPGGYAPKLPLEPRPSGRGLRGFLWDSVRSRGLILTCRIAPRLPEKRHLVPERPAAHLRAGCCLRQAT